MIAMVCVDDNMGMLFNHRRQSQDRILVQRVLEITSGKTLWMNHYSKKLFEKNITPNLRFDNQFLSQATEGEYCFVETEPLNKYVPFLESLILYKWNRNYPSDLKLDIDLSVWKKERIYDFAGYSHEKITEEVYCR